MKENDTVVPDHQSVINPFTDAMGLLFLGAFIAVAAAVWNSGARHVLGVLPLWALVVCAVAAGSVLMHWVQWSSAEYPCRLAVVWALLAAAISLAHLANRAFPGISTETPLLNAYALQWALVAATIWIGASAILDHFRTLFALYESGMIAPQARQEDAPARELIS